jgi:phosphate/sulfate permease
MANDDWLWLTMVVFPIEKWKEKVWKTIPSFPFKKKFEAWLKAWSYTLAFPLTFWKNSGPKEHTIYKKAMARVHLFSSLSSTPHSRHSPEYDSLVEDPPLPSKDSENITISVTPQEEGLQVESTPASPSAGKTEQEKTNELTSSSAALTAALLQNAHGNNDMVGAVAAAFSVKPGKKD